MVVVIDPHQRTATVYRAPDDICIITEGDMLDGCAVVLDGECRWLTCSNGPSSSGFGATQCEGGHFSISDGRPFCSDP